MPYFPVFIFMLVMLAFGVIVLLLASFLRPIRPGKVKSEPYECGIETKGDARGRFSVHFYVIAVLFLIFDVESIFLFPWAVMYKKLALFGLIEMVVFIIILFIGWWYAWKKGALDWEYSKTNSPKI